MIRSNRRLIGAALMFVAPLALLVLASHVLADDESDPDLRAANKGPDSQSRALTTNELAMLVAPVALYPDTLLQDVLDAAKSPHALVMASDFIRAPNGTDQVDEGWPKSVRALLSFPNVLLNLDGNLGYTTRLGHAWHYQKNDVGAVIQLVRQKAKAAGNLESNDKLKVITKGKEIEVVSADPDQVYVPYYDPAWIFVHSSVRGGPLLHFHAAIDLHDAITHHAYLHGKFPQYRWSPGPAHPVTTPHHRQGLQAGFDPNFGHLGVPHPMYGVAGPDYYKNSGPAGNFGRLGSPSNTSGGTDYVMMGEHTSPVPDADSGDDDGIYYNRRLSARQFNGGIGYGHGGGGRRR